MNRLSFSISKSLIISFLMIFFLVKSYGQETNDRLATDTVTVSGQCYTCKTKIQDTLKKTEGVSYVNYNLSQQRLIVSYDPSAITIYQICYIVSLLGYDTEFVLAEQAAYDSLVGTCCEYVRSIVIASINEIELKKVNIYPNPTSDYIKFDNLENTFNEIIIFDNQGRVAKKEILNSNILNISNLPKANYLLLLKNKNKTDIFRITKI